MREASWPSSLPLVHKSTFTMQASRSEDRVLSNCRLGMGTPCSLDNRNVASPATVVADMSPPRFLRIMDLRKGLDGVDRRGFALDGCIRLHLLSAETTIAEFCRGASPKYAISILPGFRRWLVCGLSRSPWSLDMCSAFLLDRGRIVDRKMIHLGRLDSVGGGWKISICGSLRVASGLMHSASRRKQR